MSRGLSGNLALVGIPPTSHLWGPWCCNGWKVFHQIFGSMFVFLPQFRIKVGIFSQLGGGEGALLQPYLVIKIFQSIIDPGTTDHELIETHTALMTGWYFINYWGFSIHQNPKLRGNFKENYSRKNEMPRIALNAILSLFFQFGGSVGASGRFGTNCQVLNYWKKTIILDETSSQQEDLLVCLVLCLVVAVFLERTKRIRTDSEC